DRSAQPGKTGGSGSAAGSAGSAASGSAAGSATDPWVARAPTPDTPETRQQRAEAALGRVASIKPVVAKLRALSFERDVPTKYQSTADFQTFVHGEIAKELPGDRSRDLSAALLHLGFLAKPVDLATVEEHATITQASAYYSPAAKAF